MTDQPIQWPTFTATDTTFTIHDSRFAEVHRELHQALMAWCETHGLDPHRIPVLSTIERDVDGRCIRYQRFETNEDGRKILGADGEPISVAAVALCETAPAPFPRLEENP